MLLEKTVAPCPLPEKKKAERRTNVLLSCNTDGSERYDPALIGNTARLHALQKKNAHVSWLDYHENRKTCMISDLFLGWLKRFIARISGTSDQEVILYIDNCSARSNDTNILRLANVTVKCFPPNTTSKIQSLDTGVIASLNLCLRFNRWHQTTSRLKSSTYERSLESTATKIEVITGTFEIKVTGTENYYLFDYWK